MTNTTNNSITINSAAFIAREASINRILQERGADYSVSYYAKPTDAGFENAYTIKSFSGMNCTPLVYLDGLDDLDDVSLADVIDDAYKKHAIHVSDSQFVNRSYILSRVLPRLRCGDAAGILQEADMPYVPFVDMVVSFYVPIDAMSSDDAQANMQVTNKLLYHAGIELSEICGAALKNISSQSHAYTLDSVLGLAASDCSGNLGAVQVDGNMLVLTNETQLYGASVLLDNKLMAKVEEAYGKCFVILPSSVHEVLIVDDPGEERNQFSDMVRDVNETQVEPEERLADHAYLYDGGVIMAIR